MLKNNQMMTLWISHSFRAKTFLPLSEFSPAEPSDTAKYCCFYVTIWEFHTKMKHRQIFALVFTTIAVNVKKNCVKWQQCQSVEHELRLLYIIMHSTTFSALFLWCLVCSFCCAETNINNSPWVQIFKFKIKWYIPFTNILQIEECIKINMEKSRTCKYNSDS